MFIRKLKISKNKRTSMQQKIILKKNSGNVKRKI